MSTISVALAERLTVAHADAGQRFVAAPVFGRPEMAATAKLFIVAAGAPDAVDDCLPLFAAMGQNTFPIGDEPKAANLVKLTGNFLIAAVIEGLGEAMALVGKAGVDRRRYLDILTSTLFTAPVYRTYGELIVEQGSSRQGSRRRWGTRTSASPSPRRRRFACPCHSQPAPRPVLDAPRARRRRAGLVSDRATRRE